MIVGEVNTDHEAIIRFMVRGANGRDQEIEAIIDTGFTGFLTLPSEIIASLGFTRIGSQPSILGDGSLQLFDVYEGTVMWDGRARTVDTDAAEVTPLVGMGMMQGYDLHIEVVEGGTVTIEELS